MLICNHTGSLTLQLRDASRIEYNTVVREGMKKVADDIQTAISAFKEKPTGENLAILNGLWARGCLWLGSATWRDPAPGKVAVAA
jgi:hypothetical protein